jgi:hypothetical protein
MIGAETKRGSYMVRAFVEKILQVVMVKKFASGLGFPRPLYPFMLLPENRFKDGFGRLENLIYFRVVASVTCRQYPRIPQFAVADCKPFIWAFRRTGGGHKRAHSLERHGFLNPPLALSSWIRGNKGFSESHGKTT